MSESQEEDGKGALPHPYHPLHPPRPVSARPGGIPGGVNHWAYRLDQRPTTSDRQRSTTNDQRPAINDQRPAAPTSDDPRRPAATGRLSIDDDDRQRRPAD